MKAFLDEKADQYNRPEFIQSDPISIPHRFTQKQDIEITGFWSSMLAWGQRVTIINKCCELFALMDNAPYEFIMNHDEADLKRLLSFKHRTFNVTDTLYFISFFRHHYSLSDTLETAFISGSTASGIDNVVEQSLNHFRNYFFSLPDSPLRTVKHVSSPAQKSACKRLNMFLRWMVRSDDRGVDFGIWKALTPAALICPTDVHVERVARKLGLITRKQTDWQTALELSQNLRMLDAADPVRYDFALFGLGIEEKFWKD